MAELQWVVDVRALMARVEQVNPQASFQPDGLARTRPTPYPLLPPDVPVPVLPAPAPAPRRSTVAVVWPQGPPFDLADALRRGVAGQRRTGSHKQFTFVFLDDPTWIYKGPYSAEKVSRYAARVAVLARWALPNVVLPDERVFPASVQGPKKELFLRFPNLAKEYPVETEAGVHKESFSTYEYTVLKRTVLVKAKDVIGNKEYPWALAFVPTLTYQLAALALLDVGDVHLSNVLVDLEKKEFFIIDVEETRHQPAVGPWAFFTKPPAAPLQPLWTAELRKGLPSVVEALRALPVGPDLDDRRTALIKDLETYYPPLGAPVPSPPPSPPRLSARPSAPRVPPAAVVATAPIGAQGQMSYLGGTAGLARSLTYSGLRLDVAKSGMQKYMRRARADDALVMAFEIFRFREIPVGAVITNLRNRLSVAAAEDVGPADVPTVLATLRVCNDPTHVLTDLELFDVVTRISASAKSRVCSWVARTYGAQADAARAAGVAVDRDDTPAPTTDWPWRPDDPPEVIRLGNLFYDRLKKKDLNVFKWAPIAEQAWAGTQLPKAWPGTRRTKPTMLLWRMLDAQGLPKDVLTALEKAYDTVSETTPFLRLGLWLCVQGLQPPGAPLDIQPTYTISDLLTGKYRVVVDEFVVDKHTKAGRGLGLGRTEFAVEGSKVVNEDPRFLTMSTDLFRRLYEL